MSPRSMPANYSENELLLSSLNGVVHMSYETPSNGAGFSPIPNYSAPELLSPLSSLQVIAFKGEIELLNYSPLRGEEKAAQNGFSLPFEVPGEAGKRFTHGAASFQQTAPAGLPGILPILGEPPMRFLGKTKPPAAMLATVRQTHIRALAGALAQHPCPVAIRAPGMTAAHIRAAHKEAFAITRKGA